MYVDESGVDQYFYRPFARSIVGKSIFGAISGRRYQRESFVAAKVNGKVIAPFCYQGTCDTNLFNFWIDQFLVPVLRPGQVVILDNATFHKSQKTKELVHSAGCRVVFLPPYSPDLNPIERFWANLKRTIRENLKKFKTLSEAIDYSFLKWCG